MSTLSTQLSLFGRFKVTISYSGEKTAQNFQTSLQARLTTDGANFYIRVSFT